MTNRPQGHGPHERSQAGEATTPGRPAGDLPLHRVAIDPAHYRSGRPFLVGQGIVLAAIGVAALTDIAITAETDTRGVLLLGLRVTLVQGLVLIVWGVAAVLCALSRRSAVRYAAGAATVSLALTIVAAVAAAHADTGPMGFDLRDILLYGVLGAWNIALLLWLNADEIEGPEWVPSRRGAEREKR